MEALRVDRAEYDGALTRDLHPASRVVDYYGLVEQVGVIYPLCEHGMRHVPVWAEVLVPILTRCAPSNAKLDRFS